MLDRWNSDDGSNDRVSVSAVSSDDGMLDADGWSTAPAQAPVSADSIPSDPINGPGGWTTDHVTLPAETEDIGGGTRMYTCVQCQEPYAAIGNPGRVEERRCKVCKRKPTYDNASDNTDDLNASDSLVDPEVPGAVPVDPTPVPVAAAKPKATVGDPNARCFDCDRPWCRHDGDDDRPPNRQIECNIGNTFAFVADVMGRRNAEMTDEHERILKTLPVCKYCRGRKEGRRGRKYCSVCWGSGFADQKHPDPEALYKPGKWGIYDLSSEKRHLVREIQKAERNKKTGKTRQEKYPKDGPCETKKGNEFRCVRQRYLVTNTKGQQVYIVKTYGNTGNAGHFTEGDKREVHNVNTVGEFKSSLENKDKKDDGYWYSVYWRCQKPNHDLCDHDTE